MRLYNQCISDNCMPPQEILHSMEDSGINNNLMNVKLDMQRAYDRMRWKFIRRVLMKFVFSEKWLAWIEPSISSVTFVVLVTLGKAQWFFVERFASGEMVALIRSEKEIVVNCGTSGFMT